MAEIINLKKRSTRNTKGVKQLVKRVFAKVKETYREGYFNVNDYRNWVTGYNDNTKTYPNKHNDEIIILPKHK